MKGAEIIFIPTAIGYIREDGDEAENGEAGEREAWEIVQRGHSVANGCFLAAVNRVGYEKDPGDKGGLDFWGASFIADPYGRVVKQASDDEEEILVHPIDLSFVEETRDLLAHFYRDRRIDTYGDLTQRFLD